MQDDPMRIYAAHRAVARKEQPLRNAAFWTNKSCQEKFDRFASLLETVEPGRRATALMRFDANNTFPCPDEQTLSWEKHPVVQTAHHPPASLLFSSQPLRAGVYEGRPIPAYRADIVWDRIAGFRRRDVRCRVIDGLIATIAATIRGRCEVMLGTVRGLKRRKWSKQRAQKPLQPAVRRLGGAAHQARFCSRCLCVSSPRL